MTKNISKVLMAVSLLTGAQAFAEVTTPIKLTKAAFVLLSMPPTSDMPS